MIRVENISPAYTNIEIICIDDCSTDNSLSILNEYSKKYNQIKVIALKQNGITSVRNEGLKHATGKYIGFVDCDDYIEPQTYEKALLMIQKYNADIVCWGTNIIFEDIKQENELELQEFHKMKFSGYKELNKEIIAKTTFTVWNKLFKANIIYENNVLSTNGLIFEYYEFFYKYIAHCKSIYFIKENLYNYIRHAKSTTSSLNNSDDRYLNYIKVFENIYNYYKQCSLLEKQQKLLSYIFYDITNIVYKCANSKDVVKEKLSCLISKLDNKEYKEIYNTLIN